MSSQELCAAIREEYTLGQLPILLIQRKQLSDLTNPCWAFNDVIMSLFPKRCSCKSSNLWLC